MIKREDIHAILEHKQHEHYGTDYFGDRKVDYEYIKDDDYADIEQALLDLLFEINAENAELEWAKKAEEEKPRPVIANGIEYDSYADYLKSKEEEKCES